MPAENLQPADASGQHPSDEPRQPSAPDVDILISAAPRVSVVVVSYFTGAILNQTLAAILDEPQVAQVLLVNNGNPAEVTRELQQWSGREPRLTVLHGHGNIGFSAGCNLGARAATGEYLLFLNPDCVLAADGVAQMQAAAADLPEQFILSPMIVNPDGSEQRGSRRQVLTPWRAIVEWFGLYRLAPNHPYFKRFNLHDTSAPQDLTPVDVTSGAAMFMRKSFFDRLGGFDQAFFMHVEDIDICVRVLKQGGQNYLLPNVRATHFVSSSRVSPVRVEWYKTRGFQKYFSKHFKQVYPRGFVPMVNAAVMCRYFLQLPALLWRQHGLARTRPNKSHSLQISS